MPKIEKTHILDFLERHASDLDNLDPSLLTTLTNWVESDYPEKKRGRKNATENPAELTDTSMFISDELGIEDYSYMPEFLNILGESNDAHARLAICLEELGLLKSQNMKSTRLFMDKFIDTCPDRTFTENMSKYKTKDKSRLPEVVYPNEQKEKDKQTILYTLEEMKAEFDDYLGYIQEEWR